MASGAAGIDLVGRMPGLRHPSVLSAMTRAVASARDAILVVAKVLLLLSRRRRPQPAAELRRLLPAATSRHGEIRGGVEMVRGGVEGGGGRSVEVGSGGCRRRVAEGRGGAQVNARQRDPSKPTFKDGAASQLYLVVKNEVGSGGCRRRVAEGRGGAQVNALQRDPSKPAFKDRAARQLNLVVKNEGWERLYGGLMASLVGTAASQGVYYYFYQIFRNRAEAKALERSRRGLGYGSVGMIQSLTVAALSGCINVLITNPIWVDVHEYSQKGKQTAKPSGFNFM